MSAGKPEPVKDARIIQFVRNHPNATAREVAQRFYTVKSQLVVGSRLARLVTAGLLTKHFNDGWKYSALSTAENHGNINENASVPPHNSQADKTR